MRIIGGVVGNNLEYEFNREGADGAPPIQGQVTFSQPVTIAENSAPEFVKIHSDIDGPVVDVDISLMGGSDTSGSLRVSSENGTSYVRLVSAPVYLSVENILRGDVDEAINTIREQYGERFHWEFRNDCRDTLPFETYVQVLDSLSSGSGRFSHVQFRSGLGYFAKRIGETVPQGIHSFSDLSKRVERWNESENLESVALSEVVSEKLGRRWYRDDFGAERKELAAIGFDPIQFDTSWETTAPASWIAHVVLTSGVEEAAGVARARETPADGPYEDVKSDAYDAQFGQRGPAWGAVLPFSAQPGVDDFRYDGYQYLKWIAEEYRGKGKFSAMLFAAAYELAPDELPPRHFQELDFKQLISVGHTWRRDGAMENAREGFREAYRIAQGGTQDGYTFSAPMFIEAKSSLAHTEAILADNKRSSLQIYDEAIEQIENIGEKYDLREDTVSRELKFLRRERGKAD